MPTHHLSKSWPCVRRRTTWISLGDISRGRHPSTDFAADECETHSDQLYRSERNNKVRNQSRPTWRSEYSVGFPLQQQATDFVAYVCIYTQRLGHIVLSRQIHTRYTTFYKGSLEISIQALVYVYTRLFHIVSSTICISLCINTIQKKKQPFWTSGFCTDTVS